MKESFPIRNFYKPVQPAVKLDNKQIIYLENHPAKELENLVYCYWQLKSTEKLEKPFSYRVVSDGCIDIFFEQQNPQNNFIVGFFRKYTQFPIGTTFNYIGIRFFPAAVPLIFGINAKTLSNKSQDLINVLPGFSDWLPSHQMDKLSFDKIIRLLDIKIKSIVDLQKFERDSRFYNSLKIILQKKGHLNIEKDLNTGLSLRQLRRIFNFNIGTTPKAFSNVVRFQHILSADTSVQSLKENKLYLDVGFFDQAHFIKDFKKFYGVIPSEAFE